MDSTFGSRRFEVGLLWWLVAVPAVLLASRLALGVGLAVAGTGPIPGGVRLVMVETASCIYCIRWHREVGPAYPLSEQGLRAPLVRRDLGDPGLSPMRKVVYTPTFILVRDGVEIDRLTGYPGPDYFWTEVDAMLARLEPVAEQPAETRIRY